MEINVLIEDGIETGPDAGWMQQIVEKVLLGEQVSPNVEISLVITGQERIQDLNREYRGKDAPTDVLSFSMAEKTEDEPEAFIGPPDGLVHLGEVIISYPQAVLQAEEHGHGIRRELATLIVHGVLHIVGYDHEKPEMEPAMLAREKGSSGKFGEGYCMRVLGIAGSPRKGGNTDTLLARFLEGASSRGAEVISLRVCDLKIAGCLHCDACYEKGICRVKDDMQMVFREMESADRIVMASPLQFMSVSAQLKALIDRCQALWVRKYVLKVPPLGDNRERKGFFISVGGRRTVPDLFDAELVTIKNIYRMIDIKYAGDLLIPGIDARGDILKHPEFLEQAYQAGQKFVEDP